MTRTSMATSGRFYWADVEQSRETAVAELKGRGLEITEAIHRLVRVYKEIYEFTWAGAINNGLCEDFAWDLCEIVSGAEAKWGDDLFDAERDDVCAQELYGYHCFVECEGRYYDSEVPEGVDDFRDLPLYLRGIP